MYRYFVLLILCLFVFGCVANRPVYTIDQADEVKWKKIDSVNNYCNHVIMPYYDKNAYGNWNFPNSMKGDCKQYTMCKKHYLAQIGIHADIAICRTSSLADFAHAVAIVDLENRTVVLDNLHSGVISYEDLHYQWIKRTNGDGDFYKIKESKNFLKVVGGPVYAPYGYNN